MDLDSRRALDDVANLLMNASPTSDPMAPLSDRQLWSIVCEAYGDDFPVILRSNVSAYERRPGLNNPIRAHKSVIGVDGVTALREALVTQRSNGFHQLQGCLEIREPLAWHLVRHLQQKLIIVGHASASIRDQRFAADLGFEFVPVMRLVAHWVTALTRSVMRRTTQTQAAVVYDGFFITKSFRRGTRQAASSLRSDTGFALEHGGVGLENQIVQTFAIFRIPRYP
ncbi:hypothetical protein [Pseudomonas sp. PGPPP2]|uniref:hypothetical protein n=1 Tax=Pseudomonas sp. PGPPP2 TaxID=2015554 RepID=UPI002579C479|nr:hypothetical protein [Pseudomonas sp. PGPPP2]